MKEVLTRASLGIVVVLAAAASIVFAQRDDSGDAEEKGPLVVTGTILSQKCRDWDKDLADLELRLQFTNNGDKPLILNTRDITSGGLKFFAFIDEVKDEVHVGETATCNLRGYSSEYDAELVSNYPNSNFVVLSPGQSYVMEDVEVVPLIASTTLNGMGGNKIDDYQVEIEFYTWATLDPKLVDKLRRKWKNVGVLWSGPVWTEPVEFTFERIRRCEE